MVENVAFASVVNDDFVPGFIVMERTLRRHHPEWNFPIYVIHEPQRCSLSRQSQDVIHASCDNVIFREVNTEDFRSLFAYAAEVIGTPARLLAAFYIFSAFGLREFDRVVCLDSDIIITGSLRELLQVDAPFSAVRAFDANNYAPAGFVNTGVMVLCRDLLQSFSLDNVVAQLGNRLPKRGTGKADQAIINMLFGNSEIFYLPHIFNFTKRSALQYMHAHSITDPTELVSILDLRVLHYVGEKPWNDKILPSERVYEVLEGLWHKEFAALHTEELDVLMQHLRAEWSQKKAAATRIQREEEEAARAKRVAELMGQR